jgi:hypothetical protein
MMVLAVLEIWRWVEQEASSKPQAISHKLKEGCKLQAASRKLFNTVVGTIERNRLKNKNRVLLLILKIKYK